MKISADMIKTIHIKAVGDYFNRVNDKA